MLPCMASHAYFSAFYAVRPSGQEEPDP
jgi:hypothetical protein